MLRSHTNGELRITEVGQEVTLCGWVHKSRDKGGMIWVDLRDRYGITQLMLEEGKSSPEALAMARGLGREFVIEAVGVVVERLAKNDKLPTGYIEIKIKNIRILNPWILSNRLSSASIPCSIQIPANKEQLGVFKK